jgi:hypothetical protein
LLKTLCTEALLIKSHPNNQQKIDMTKSSISEWPHLTESFGRGYDGWLSSVVEGLKASRRQLGLVDPERPVAVRKRQATLGGSATPLSVLTEPCHQDNTSTSPLALSDINVAGKGIAETKPSSSRRFHKKSKSSTNMASVTERRSACLELFPGGSSRENQICIQQAAEADLSERRPAPLPGELTPMAATLAEA